jgi:hypothetical protein
MLENYQAAFRWQFHDGELLAVVSPPLALGFETFLADEIFRRRSLRQESVLE